MNIHILRQQGLSIRKIAALRGVSRNAVRRALRSSAPPSGKRQRTRGAKLQSFTGMIDAWLRDPVKSQWTAARIFDEIQDRGYEGGHTVLKEYVHLHRPKPPVIAEARFLVKPGQQVQVDWAEMGPTSVGGVTRKLYAFVAILAWSRTLFPQRSLQTLPPMITLVGFKPYHPVQGEVMRRSFLPARVVPSGSGRFDSPHGGDSSCRVSR